jgi:hypothetical protein
MKKLLLALALMMPAEAAAATWKKASASFDERTTGWVDMSSIRVNKTYKSAWTRMNISDGSWVVSFIGVRCAAKSYLEAKMIYYERDGSSNDITPNDGTWKLATPDSIMDGILDVICEDTAY